MTTKTSNISKNIKQIGFKKFQMFFQAASLVYNSWMAGVLAFGGHRSKSCFWSWCGFFKFREKIFLHKRRLHQFTRFLVSLDL